MKKLLILILLIAAIVGCKTNHNSESDSNPIVTVSILPQKYFIDRISGGLIDVNVMVPEGSDPHIYEPSARQMKDLSNSDAYFRMGYIEFEQAWMDKFKALNSSMKIIDLSRKASLIIPKHDHHNHDHGNHNHNNGIDPHIWSSSAETKKITELLFESLVSMYPQNKDDFTVNYESFSKELDSLDNYIKEKFQSLEGNKFMIFHSALAYFARDYNLEQVSIETDGKEPTPVEIKKIIELARKENIKVIFVQKQFNMHSAEVLAKEINGRVVQIDPLGYNWMETTKQIADEIALIYSAE